MSIALAIVSHRNVVVASEGRAIQNGQIISDCFDKTFSLPDRKTLGAHTGSLQFSGMKVGEHVNEIVAIECADADSLRNMIKSSATYLHCSYTTVTHICQRYCTQGLEAAIMALVCVAIICSYRSYSAIAERGCRYGKKLAHALLLPVVTPLLNHGQFY